MRNNSSNRRSRGRGGSSRKGGGNQRSQVFDSNGPDVRIRGTAHQVCEKYLALAKDAASSGDRVMAESYMQHAEHYQRIISSWNQDVNNRDQKARSNDQQQEQPQDDLSLPNSILGESSNAEPANTRTEKRTADNEALC